MGVLVAFLLSFCHFQPSQCIDCKMGGMYSSLRSASYSPIFSMFFLSLSTCLFPLPVSVLHSSGVCLGHQLRFFFDPMYTFVALLVSYFSARRLEDY